MQLFNKFNVLQVLREFRLPKGAQVKSEIGTASATAGAATLDRPTGIVTSEAVTTAAAAAYTLTLTNSKIKATDIVLATIANGTNSAGVPLLSRVTPGNGSVVFVIQNGHAANAFNGTLKVSYAVLSAV